MTTTLTTTARCIDCPWTAQGPTADRQSVAHMNATGHATGSKSTPIHADAPSAPVREGQK